MDYFDHIETREGVLGGKPVIKGTRISVELLLGFLAAGWSVDDILREYPLINSEDIRAIFALATELVKEERFIIESNRIQMYVMHLLADENIPRGMIAALRLAGHQVLSMAETAPQTPDDRVLATAVEQGLVLLTFDADFGRMIFAEGYRAPPGVIYLRSPPPSPQAAIDRVLRVARDDAPSIDGHFVSVDRKARYHPLPESEQNG